MNNVKPVREHLGLTQAALAEELGCSQSNVSFYEKGQTVPPHVGEKFVHIAKKRGLDLTFGQVYGLEPLPQGVHAFHGAPTHA